jgi:uncharacterized protein (UPF0264 family)
MRLLVSVRNVHEAAAALAGGADIVDAKEPSMGALGAVALPIFRDMCAMVGARAPISAALGDVASAAEVEALARAYAFAGASFAKIGFAGMTSPARVEQILTAGVCTAPRSGRINRDVRDCRGGLCGREDVSTR